jgi:hypothetical protein
MIAGLPSALKTLIQNLVQLLDSFAMPNNSVIVVLSLESIALAGSSMPGRRSVSDAVKYTRGWPTSDGSMGQALGCPDVQYNKYVATFLDGGLGLRLLNSFFQLADQLTVFRAMTYKDRPGRHRCLLQRLHDADDGICCTQHNCCSVTSFTDCI